MGGRDKKRATVSVLGHTALTFMAEFISINRWGNQELSYEEFICFRDPILEVIVQPQTPLTV